jgi:hypothetical protein
MGNLTVNLFDVASTYSLMVIETTSELNGYPSNLKNALIGFNTFEDAKKIADENKLLIQFFKKKDGWNLWYRTNDIAYNPIRNKAEDYGDNYKEYNPTVYTSLEYLYEVEFQELIKNNNFSLQELKDYIKLIENLYELIEACNEGDIVISDLYNHYVVPEYTTYFQYDTNHLAIGLIQK